MATYQETIQAPLVLIPQHFGSLIFDRSISRYFPFDHETTDLLISLQNIPFEAVMNAINNPEKAEQALNLFMHFNNMGFFTSERYFAGAVLDAAPADNHLTGPLAVHLEVIAACNLTCTHCFAGDLPRKEEPLTKSELNMLFEDMARMGSYRLGLTGGEPLLRRDIFEVIDLATEYGLHPCLTTNALLLTEDIAREFSKRKLVWLNVSLEGATSVTNDRVRGKGTFEKVIQKLRMLAQHTRFTLAFTIMSINAEEVAACAELAYEVGASTAVFRPLYPVGTAQHFIEELMPTFQQYNAALNTLAQLEFEEGHLHSADPFSPHARSETQAVTYTNLGCGAGNLVCSVSVSGDVNPCSFLGSSFIADNIRNRPLSKIWHEGHKFQEIRNLPGGTEDTFSGGCRARSLMLNGSANAPDPWLSEKLAAEAHPRQSNVTFYEPLTVLDVTAYQKDKQ